MRYPNVYADTSGVRRFDYIMQAARRAGAAGDPFWPGWTLVTPRSLELSQGSGFGTTSWQKRSSSWGGNWPWPNEAGSQAAGGLQDKDIFAMK